jgi:predicted Zn finger-like uncharacterized protein
MTEITKCPQCGTRFKVTKEQLDAHEGLVRCGHCHEVFDADKYIQHSGPSPQLDLPIENASARTEPDLTPIDNVPELEVQPTTLAQQVQFVEELTDEVLELPKRKMNWLGMLASLLLLASLAAQVAYFFPVEIGARLPGLKPQLEQFCELLQCTIELPQNADKLVIESSELESAPGHNNIVTLHALIHNQAFYPQAFPSLELTLTSIQDQSIARRVFHPADYLKPDQDENRGLPGNRDLDIRLHLDTTDLRPAGYRLFLYYPE